jgi:hypothetical protein
MSLYIKVFAFILIIVGAFGAAGAFKSMDKGLESLSSFTSSAGGALLDTLINSFVLYYSY